MHKEQREFCEQVKEKFPEYFTQSRVIDFGSLDVNGNNRYLFDTSCTYTGVDLGPGKNVDVVLSAHLFTPEPGFEPDVIISTEMLEHDRNWDRSLRNMLHMLKRGGLIIVTCATDDREEHGTREHNPQDSPYTNDYYRNVSLSEFKKAIHCELKFLIQFEIRRTKNDLQFWGIKQ